MEYSVKFTQQEMRDLGQHLDQSVRASGIQGARSALALLAKLEAAIVSQGQAGSETQTQNEANENN